MKKFKVVNNLDKFINIRQAQMMLKLDGTRITRKQIEEELAGYCGTSHKNIISIERNINPSSIDIAMLICEFFECSFEEMFCLVEGSVIETDVEDDEFLVEAKEKLLEVYPEKVVKNLIAYGSLYRKLNKKAQSDGKTIRDLVETMGFQFKNKRKSS